MEDWPVSQKTWLSLYAASANVGLLLAAVMVIGGLIFGVIYMLVGKRKKR